MNAILILLLSAVPAEPANAASTSTADPARKERAQPDIVLLDFTAGYCPPCQQMVPVLQRMEADGYPIQKIDITEHPELARQYNVKRIPTFVLLVEGRVLKRLEGLLPETQLRQEMQKAKQDLEQSRPSVDTARAASATAGANPARTNDERKAESSPAAPGVVQPGDSAPDKPLLADLFRSIVGAGSKRTRFEFPTFRGQSPEKPAMPAGLANALAATVRVRVASDKLQDVGTGTIIYSRTGESVILTCAHLFLDMNKSSNFKVEVEVLNGNQPVVYPASVVGGSHDSDLALLTIRTARALPFVAVTETPVPVREGQQAVSFGCNNGSDPTELRTKILRINQFTGPSNVTCETDPLKGRSGGGLFDESGRLIAVCSAADRDTKQGMYMSQAAIMKQLVSLQRTDVLKPATGDASQGENAAELFAEAAREPSATATGSTADFDEAKAAETPVAGAANTPVFEEQNLSVEAKAPEPSKPHASENAANSVASSGPKSGSTAALSAESTETAASTGSDLSTTSNSSASVAANEDGTEVTVMINSRQPGGPKRIIVIPRATPWLLELLTGEAAPAIPAKSPSAVVGRPVSAKY